MGVRAGKLAWFFSTFFSMNFIPKSRRWRIGIPVVLLLVGGLVKWLVFPSSPGPAYISAPVQRQDMEDTVLASGIIKAYKLVSVGAQVSGQIAHLYVALGQQVKKGDLVAEIDPRTKQNDLLTAQSQLTNFQAQLLSAQATLIKARQDFERQKKMLAEEATSRENYDGAKATLETAQAAVDQMKAQVDQYRVNVETAKINLGYTRILAPMDGVVVSVPVDEGQTVNAVQSAPTIIQLANLDTMTVKAEISEGDVPRVKPGLPTYFTILGEPDRPYYTRLRSIDPGPESMSDSSTSTTTTASSNSSSSSSGTAIYYYGLMDVPNREHRLRIGMTAQVSIVLARVRQALTIPSSALGDKDRQGRYQVRVLGKDQQPVVRWVRIGLNNNVSAQVLEGLREGEAVVVGEQSTGGTAQDSSKSRRGPPPMGM